MDGILFGQDEMKRALWRPWHSINKFNIKLNLKHQYTIMWTGLISLSIGTRSELSIIVMKLRFHRSRRISLMG
jgi:hypothetical protein